MKSSIEHKLEHLCRRHEEIEGLLQAPDVTNDVKQFTKLNKEYAELSGVVRAFNDYKTNVQSMADTEAMMDEDDAELKAMATLELQTLKTQQDELLQTCMAGLIPQDPTDEANCYLEIRAGTGGDEASIFVGDLLKMYTRYSESKRWNIDIMSANASEQGGYKEVIIKIEGKGVYGLLKFESGAHRVQRVPVTESQGRVHTSACTVAAMPEAETINEIDINPSDLRVDTFRASGAGGQHVNKTDSAIRITHIPTGVVVECQDERSQHKNRARAMGILQARLMQAQVDAQRESRATQRRELVGSGDRSERIRTYNFPQGRVTDHRINLTLYQLDDVMEGALGAIIDPLTQEHQADQLAALNDDELA